MTNDKSCWTCHHHKGGGINLLGKCSLHDKEITSKKSVDGSYIIDKGCAKWEVKDKFKLL